MLSVSGRDDLGLLAFIMSNFTTPSPSATGGTEVQLKNVDGSVNFLQTTGQHQYIFLKSTVSSLPIKTSRSSFIKIVY